LAKEERVARRGEISILEAISRGGRYKKGGTTVWGRSDSKKGTGG